MWRTGEEGDKLRKVGQNKRNCRWEDDDENMRNVGVRKEGGVRRVRI